MSSDTKSMKPDQLVVKVYKELEQMQYMVYSFPEIDQKSALIEQHKRIRAAVELLEESINKKALFNQ